MGHVAEVSEGGEPARGGYSRSVSGLFGALLAVLVLIVAIWGLTRFQHRNIPDPARTIDYTSDLALAREKAPFGVLAPRPAPPGWRATSAQWNGQGPTVSWHLGFLTPEGEYVGLEQSNAATAGFVRAHTAADQPGSPVSISGQQWQTLSSSGGSEHALLRADGGVTTLVTGTAPLKQLREFAASLAGG
jgi:Protein of unknown function (DUF4245)